MKRSPLTSRSTQLPLSRRALLHGARALGQSALLGPWLAIAARAAATRVAVERGAPQQLPLEAVAELDLDSPASIDDEPVDLAVLTLGGIEVASGILVATDGLLLDGPPLAARVASGRYPVQIVLARLLNGEERVALVQLKLAERPAVRWIGADPEGAEPADEDEVTGIDVESGMACLIDAGALAAWRTALSTNPAELQSLERVLRENRRPNWTWARVRAGGAAGVLITAGLGEGTYAAWWGLDAAGLPVSLVLDFDLLGWAGLPEVPPVEA